MFISKVLGIRLEPMQVPVVKSPLGIIALFVALIEAFLAYPLTQLTGLDRTFIVVFMTLFPTFVAAAFFVILWNRPLNLYNPKEIPEKLLNRYMKNVAETAVLEETVKELQEQILNSNQLRSQNTTIFTVPEIEKLKTVTTQGIAMERLEQELQSLTNQLKTKVDTASVVGDATDKKVKDEVKQLYQKSKNLKIDEIVLEIEKFREWLEKRGFQNLPDVPKIELAPPGTGIAEYNGATDIIKIDRSLENDPQLLAFLYFGKVIRDIVKVKGWDPREEEDDTRLDSLAGSALYYAASYTQNPRIGERTFLSIKEEILDLEHPTEAKKQNDSMDVYWASACWELRRFGAENVDLALYKTLVSLPARATLAEAVSIFAEQMASVTGGRAPKEEVLKILDRKGVKVTE
jgi:hypothetical protein